MSYFMRFTNARPDGVVNEAIERAKGLAKTQFKNMGFDGEFPVSGYGITTMRPYHIQAGGTNWGSSDYWASCFAASLTWENWISITQTDLAFEILTGMFNLAITPKTVEVYIQADGHQMPTINVEEMYAYDVSRLFWKRPMVITPEKSWDFARKGLNTGVEREGLMGYTLGTRAYLILRN